MDEEVKLLDAGGTLILSSSNEQAIETALRGFVRRGSKVVTPVGQVGRQWVAACTVPPRASGVDTTQTLRLSDIVAATAAPPADAPFDAAPSAAPTAAPEIDDGCRVVSFGFKSIVYGPSLPIVQLRVARMQQSGAQLEGDIEQEDAEWVAVCDTSRVGNEKRDE